MPTKYHEFGQLPLMGSYNKDKSIYWRLWGLTYWQRVSLGNFSCALVSIISFCNSITALATPAVFLEALVTNIERGRRIKIPFFEVNIFA